MALWECSRGRVVGQKDGILAAPLRAVSASARRRKAVALRPEAIRSSASTVVFRFEQLYQGDRYGSAGDAPCWHPPEIPHAASKPPPDGQIPVQTAEGVVVEVVFCRTEQEERLG